MSPLLTASLRRSAGASLRRERGGFASGGSIRSSDIPVAVGGRAERGQECPRSLPLRFGGSVGASLRREREGLRLWRQHKEQRHSCRWRGDVHDGDKNVPAPYCFASAEHEGLRFGGARGGLRFGGSVSGSASGGSMRSLASGGSPAGFTAPQPLLALPKAYSFPGAVSRGFSAHIGLHSRNARYPG